MRSRGNPTPELRRTIKRTLERTLLSIVGRRRPIDFFSGPVNSVAVLAQERIGDALLLTPLLRGLRRAYPSAEIHVVLFSRQGSILHYEPSVTAIHRAKPNPVAFGMSIRRKRFDILFNPKDHPSSTFLLWSLLIRARVSVGIAHEKHAGFYNHCIDIPFDTHVVEKNCSLLAWLGKPLSGDRLRPAVPPGPVSGSVAAFVETGLPRGAVGINLSAGHPDREWPLSKWKELIGKLDRPVAVLSMPDRAEDKRTLEKACARVVVSPVTGSIFDAAAIVEKLSLLVSPDTALIHVASCVNVPVVGLYRNAPVHVQRFYPFMVEHRRVDSSTERVGDIGVEDVKSAAQEILGDN